MIDYLLSLLAVLFVSFVILFFRKKLQLKQTAKVITERFNGTVTTKKTYEGCWVTIEFSDGGMEEYSISSELFDQIEVNEVYQFEAIDETKTIVKVLGKLI